MKSLVWLGFFLAVFAVRAHAAPLQENQDPVGTGDLAYECSLTGVLTVTAPGVLANDSDPDGDPLTAVLANDYTTGLGTLTFYVDGSFNFTPTYPFVDGDLVAFTYRAADPSGAQSNETTVLITMRASIPPEPDLLTVTGMIPAPGDTLSSLPSEVLVTFSGGFDPDTIGPGTITLVRRGVDGVFDTGDDIAITPLSIAVLGVNQARIDLTGVSLPNDVYRVRVSGTEAISLSTGLVGHWKLDASSGSTAVDSSGSSNDGAFGGGPQWQPVGGMLSGAVSFDGVDDCVVVPQSASLEPTTAMSVSVWARITSSVTPFADIIRKAGPSSGYLLRWNNTDSRLQFRIDRAGNPDLYVADTQTTAGYLNAWHHFVGTCDSATGIVALYVDGVLHNSTSGLSGNLEHSEVLYMMYAGERAVPGLLDDVRIYNRALTAGEVAQLNALGGGVRNTSDQLLDGEFAGAFPSGNGAAGGDFVATFTINVLPSRVTAMTPAPESTLTSIPSEILVTLSGTLDSSTVNSTTISLVRQGPDASFGTLDDAVVAPASIEVIGTGQVRIDLGGVSLPNDMYRLTLFGSAVASLSTGLVGYWPCDEGVGGTAADSSDTGADGTLNGPAWAAGRVSTALTFDGTNDYVVVGDSPNLTPSNAISVAVWVSADIWESSNRILQKGANANYQYVLECSATNQLRFGLRGIGDVFVTAPSLGQWHHVAGTYDGAEMRMYIDGTLVGHTAASGSIFVSTDSLYIGTQWSGSPTVDFFDGSLDELRIYGRALTQREVVELAALGAAVRNFSGDLLDGEFAGTFPSGNGVAGGDFEASFEIGAPITVGSALPANGDGDVFPNTAISLAFNAEMNHASVESAFSITPSVTGTFSWNGLTMTFQPSSDLSLNTVYTVVLSTSAQDVAGGPLAAAYELAFTTASVTGTALPGGYVKSMLHLGAAESDRITGLQFSGDEMGNLWDFFKLGGLGHEYLQQPAPGRAAPLANINATQDPLVWTARADSDNDGSWDEGLGDKYVSYGALYVILPSPRHVKVSADYDDLLDVWVDGNPVPIVTRPSPEVLDLDQGIHCFIIKHWENQYSDFFWIRFTDENGADMADLRYVLDDYKHPEVRSTFPAASAADVSSDGDIVVQFTEAMDTAVSASTVASITGGTASGTWTWGDAYTLVWTPVAALESGVAYTVSLDPSNARDLRGNTLRGNSQCVFTTAARSSPVVASISATSGNTDSVVSDIVVSGSGFAEGAVTHPSGALPFNGHYYRLSGALNTWHDAKAACEAAGGHLATLSSVAEDEFVWRLGAKFNCWIGFTDEGSQQNWRWVTGESVAYTHWVGEEPNNWLGQNEDWGLYWWGFGWADNVEGTRPYVCEFDTRSAPTVRLVRAGQTDITAGNVRFGNSGTLTCNFNLASAAAGVWDVVVVNPDGGTAALPSAFTVVIPPPVQVTAVSPSPGSLVSTLPAEILVTFSGEIAPSTIDSTTITLVRRGLDGVFGTDDDVSIVPALVSAVGSSQARLDLAGVALPNDVYRVRCSGTEAASLSTGLVGHWKLDEGGGGSAGDSSSSGVSGVLSGPSWTAGQLGSALSFDGTNDSVTVPNIPALQIPGDITIAFWMRRTAAAGGWQRVVGKGGNSTRNYGVWVEASVGTPILWQQYDNVGNNILELHGSTAIQLNTWYHVTCTVSGSTAKIYVNGREDSSGTRTGTAATSSDPLTFSYAGIHNYFPGYLDDVRIYNRALTATEVQPVVSSGGGVRSAVGALLDGEFSGTLPSGDGTAGGDFVATFTVDVPPPVVTGVSPVPASILTSVPADVLVTLDRDIDGDTVNGGTVLLLRGGPDRTLDTGDDVLVSPVSVSLVGARQVRMDLSGVLLPNDVYRLRLSGTDAASLSAGLVGHWKLDEGAGSTVDDSSAGGVNGSLNGPLWTAGRLGTALHFDGSNDSAVASSFSWPASNGPVTVTFWNYVTSQDLQQEGVAINIGNAEWPNRFNIHAPFQGAVYWQYGNDMVSTSYSAMYRDKWTHVAFVYDGTAKVVYLDGNLAVSGASTSEPVANLSGLRIGGWSLASDWHKGDLDDVRIYDRALSHTEILQMVALGGGVRSVDDRVLDGEFSGTLPSGDDTEGGDFVATFTIDTISPTVTGVTSPTADGVYRSGSTIAVSVHFSEPVIVTGDPQLTLDTGSSDAVAVYTGGVGLSTTLTFSFTVEEGQTSPDLECASTSALVGGTIRDAAGHDAILALPAAGAAGSLSTNEGIIIVLDAQVLVSTNVEPSNLVAGATGRVTITFATSNTIPADGAVEITFPDGFNVAGANGVTSTTLDGGFSVTVSGRTVTIHRDGTGTAANAGTQSLAVAGVTNPTSAGAGGTYGIRTTDAGGNTIDHADVVAGDSFEPGAILRYPGTPGYEVDGAEPDGLVGGTTVLFRVVYEELDNEAPTLREVRIDVDGDGYEPHERYVMDAEDPDDSDYRDGRVFRASVTVFYEGRSSVPYTFVFADGHGVPAVALPEGTLSVSAGVTAPVLADPDAPFVNGVSSSSAPAYHFSSIYTDVNGVFGTAPVVAEVWIDTNADGAFSEAERFGMTKSNVADENYADGAQYIFSLPLYTAGAKGYLFHFVNGTDRAGGAPASLRNLVIAGTLDADGDGRPDAEEGVGDLDGDAVGDAVDGDTVVMTLADGDIMRVGLAAVGAAFSSVDSLGSDDPALGTGAGQPNLTWQGPLATFTASGFAPGATVVVRAEYPDPVAPGSELWKYVPAWGTWHQVAYTLENPRTVLFSITDGSSLDGDGSVNGSITDPFGIGVPPAAASAGSSSGTAVIVGGGGCGLIGIEGLLFLWLATLIRVASKAPPGRARP